LQILDKPRKTLKRRTFSLFFRIIGDDEKKFNNVETWMARWENMAKTLLPLFLAFLVKKEQFRF